MNTQPVQQDAVVSPIWMCLEVGDIPPFKPMNDAGLQIWSTPIPYYFYQGLIQLKSYFNGEVTLSKRDVSLYSTCDESFRCGDTTRKKLHPEGIYRIENWENQFYRVLLSLHIMEETTYISVHFEFLGQAS